MKPIKTPTPAKKPGVCTVRHVQLWRRYKTYYLLLLPGLLYFVIWHYVPMAGIIIAFKNISPFSGLDGIINGEFVGFKHFAKFFNSFYFWNLMGNTINISVQKLIFGFPAPIILAILLNEIKNNMYKRIVQTVSYLPHFISGVIMAGLVQNVLSPGDGLVNVIIRFFGGESIFFLGDPNYFVSALVGATIWQGVGWGTIIYLAAITGINPELYEAAQVDGAGKLRQMWNITIPGIMGVACTLLILNLGGILNAGFEQVLLLYSPAVYEVADIIDTFVYREGLVQMNYSYAAAVGLFKSVVGLILVLSVNKAVKKTGNASLW